MVHAKVLHNFVATDFSQHKTTFSKYNILVWFTNFIKIC